LNAINFQAAGDHHILAHGSDYLRSDIKSLIKYAKKQKASSILVSTNAHKGFRRYLMGSFAETLILESDVPTMVVNPKAEVSEKPGLILFPTDFSAPSLEAFQQILQFAKSVGAKVRIFHQFQGGFQQVPKEVIYLADDQWKTSEALLDPSFRKVRGQLNKWLRMAKRTKVACDSQIQFGLRNIADATLQAAKKDKAWMIALASVTGRISASFIGSHARWIVRAAECPVWVVHVEKN